MKSSSEGKLILSFPVRLPSRSEPGPVDFTAYAFNEDLVKSEIARFTYTAPVNTPKSRPRAYLIGMGISASQHADRNLKFAAVGAKLTTEAFSDALEQTGKYEVVPVVFTFELEEVVKSTTATKDNLCAVLQLLAGRDISAELRGRLPKADPLRQATPDDLVLFYFSGHGYTDGRGDLYLLPCDVGEGRVELETALHRCISSVDLSTWMLASVLCWC